MLISALCSYYDTLASEGRVLKDGYSNVSVHYLVFLSPNGEITDIMDWQESYHEKDKKGKEKIKQRPRTEVMPRLPQFSGIRANIAEHRPAYIFGLEQDKKEFKTSRQKFDDFKKRNLSFLENLDSPIINAYREFINKWTPESETENPLILSISKYNTSGFAFCLDGYPDKLLHKDPVLLEAWDKFYQSTSGENKDSVKAQCAVSGEVEEIAELHNKIKGRGLSATGSILIGHKTTSGCSYGNEKAYNSNISVTAMKKYTEVFNFLLASDSHHNSIDDIHIVYWADGGAKNEDCSDLLSLSLFDKKSDKMDAEQADKMLETVIRGASNAKSLGALNDIESLKNIDPSVDFYIVGFKPNVSRIAIKFIYRKCFGDILRNIAQHQRDMQLGNEFRSVSIWRLRRELTSPKSNNEEISAPLISSLFQSIIFGTRYPEYLLSTVVRRLKTDVGSDAAVNNRIRTGIIKACLNRKSRLKNNKEEFKLSLDLNNKNQAYLCGRLFAVLEKIQQEAYGNNLNRTIKDSYFSSAASKPSLALPKLLVLAQNHLKKLSEGKTVFFNRTIQEIIDGLNGEFPDTLLLDDQGRFMIGYYQQYQSFFEKKNNNETISEEEK